ncbi:hypothetical protein PR003_g24638, partial [Phytophthora rubi]
MPLVCDSLVVHEGVELLHTLGGGLVGVAVALRCLQDWIPTSRRTACAWLDAPSDHVCVGCGMGKMREDNFSRSPEKSVKSAGVLDLIHSDVMGPMQTKTPGG